MKPAAALALAVLLAGCTFLAEGEERLVVRNESGQAVSVILRLAQDEGSFVVFSDDSYYANGAAREFALALRAGAHTLDVTTTNRIQERLVFDVPSRGDTRLELAVGPTSATLTVGAR